MKFNRRFWGVFLIVVILTAFVGCSKDDDQKKESEEAKQKFDIKVATNILETYMGYLIKEDMESAKKLYSEELLEKHKGTSSTDLKVIGYKMDEVNEVGKSALFTVRVAKSVPDKPIATLDMYSIKIMKEENDYLISEIEGRTEKDAFIEEEGIRLRDKNNVKTNLLIDKTGIPQFAFPKDDSAKVNKVEVPKDKFGIINFAYSGEKIAITTQSKDAYISVVKIDESLSVQGGGAGGGAGSGGSGTGGGAGGQGAAGPNIRVRETPVGKEINSIDLIKDGKVELVAFSLDEKFILAQYNKNSMGTSIRVYEADSGELIPISFEEEFPFGKVDVKFASFGKDTLNIEVAESKNTDKSQAQLIGKWQIDLKDYKMKKL